MKSLLPANYRPWCVACAVLSGTLGSIRLWTWAAGVDDLWEFSGGPSVVAPVPTALLVLSSGLVIALLRNAPGRRMIRCGRILVALLVVTGLWGTGRPLFDWTSPIEAWLAGFQDGLPRSRIGHLSPSTGLLLVVLAGMIGLRFPRLGGRPWAIPGLGVGLGFMFAMAGYVIVHRALGRPWETVVPTPTLALPTAMSLALLAVALAGPGASTQGETSGATGEGWHRRGPAFGYSPGFAFFALLFSLAVLGAFYLRFERKELRTATWGTLKSVAELKALETANWRREEWSRVLMQVGMVGLARELRDYTARKESTPAAAALKQNLKRLHAAGHYTMIGVYDIDAQPLLGFPETPRSPSPRTAALLRSAVSTRQVQVSDIYLPPGDEEVRLDFAFPILDRPASESTLGSESLSEAGWLGVGLIRLDPRPFVRSLVNRWPTPSRTAETLLVRRESNAVIYLSELRGRPWNPGAVRDALDTAPLLGEVVAAAGAMEGVEGDDYRGEAVLALARAVPGSPWHLVVKMDRAECYAPLRFQAWLILAGALTLSTALGLLVRLWRERQERAWRESDERFGRMAALLSDALFVADTEGRLTYASPVAHAMMGWERGEAVGRHFRELLPEQEMERGLREFECSLNGQEGPRFLEFVFKRKNGELFMAEISASAVWEEGRVAGVLGVVRDISQRKRAEAALRESEERFRSTLDHMMEGCQILGFDWRYHYVNEAAARHGHRPRQALLGRTLQEVYPGVESTPLFTVLQECMEQRTRRLIENEFTYPDGTRAWFELGIQPVPEGLFILSIDISERRRAEAELRQLSARLLNLQDEERRRIARELHDTAAQELAALSLNLSLLSSRLTNLPPRSTTLLANSVALADQCCAGVRTLSYLLHPPMLDELGLGGALYDFVDGFSRRSGIQVELILPEMERRLPRDQELALFRVVQESLANVHRHSGSPTATVRITPLPASIRLEVQDVGRGFPAPPTADPGQPERRQLGVGISGMRERIHQLGGRLEIESTPAGTTVRALLPSANGDAT